MIHTDDCGTHEGYMCTCSPAAQQRLVEEEIRRAAEAAWQHMRVDAEAALAQRARGV